MLILCIGPDTFRAQEKARELETAFRQKFDLGGSSVERLAAGKEAIKQVLERANTASLFSPRRLMRVTDLASECPKAMTAPLLQALSKDVENVIVISVESEPPAETIIKSFAQLPKFFRYDFPTQHGASFLTWVQEQAKKLGYADGKRIKRLAEMTDGDSWLAWNELVKLAAGSTEDWEKTLVPSIYDFAERYIKDGADRHAFIKDRDASREALTVFLNQARAALRVRDRDTEGLHPFVVKKMQVLAQKHGDLEKVFAVILHSMLSQRAGYGNEEEITAMM